jgi:hypothetical protein
MIFGRAFAICLLSGGLIGVAQGQNRANDQDLLRFVREMPWEQHLPDAVLIERFGERKAQFEVLREMFMRDRGLEIIGRERTVPADLKAIGIDTERLTRYRQLLNELKVKLLHGRADKTEAATFVITSRGLGVAGSSKGYAWLPSAPSLVAGNLDEYVARMTAKKDAARSKSERLATTSYTVYRPLEGHWYLFYSN